MTDDRAAIRRELLVAPGTGIPTLVGHAVAGSTVTAEVVDVERTTEVEVLDDAAGSLAAHGIRLGRGGDDGAWTLDLPADGERAMLWWLGDEMPAEVSAGLVGVTRAALRGVGTELHLRAVRHLLGDDGGELAHLVVDTVGARDTHAGRPPVVVEAAAASAGARADLVRALVDAGLEPPAAPPAEVSDVVAAASAAAARGLRAADPALRLEVAGSAGWYRSALRRVLAALAVRRQVGDVSAAGLRADVDRLDGVVAGLDDAEAVVAGLTAAGVPTGDEGRLAPHLAERRQAAVEDVRAELASPDHLALLDRLGAAPDVAEPPAEVLVDLAERSVRRVERRLAELGRAKSDHDVLWVVGGSRRAVARARVPGLLGADGREKRARRISDLLADVDTALAALSVTMRAKAEAAAAPEAREVRGTLGDRQRELVEELTDLRERLRRRRKK